DRIGAAVGVGVSHPAEGQDSSSQRLGGDGRPVTPVDGQRVRERSIRITETAAERERASLVDLRELQQHADGVAEVVGGDEILLAVIVEVAYRERQRTGPPGRRAGDPRE